MFSVTRYCRGSAIIPKVSHLFGFGSSTVNITRNAPFRSYLTPVVRGQTVKHNLQVRNVLRNTGTVAVRLASNVSGKSQKAVGYWLLTCGGMVFIAVILGGVTRLTESGLSMVTWKLLGEKMPRTEEEWIDEFRRYQQYPEYKLMNKDITLRDFKFIWHMEYGHRQWGRAIGAVFLIPAVYFWARGRFSPSLKKRVLAFGSLIGAQGLMGWYMVKSGLEDRFHERNEVPRVSQYRLATHLGLAFGLYSLFLWSALDLLLSAQAISIASRTVIKASRKFKMLAHTTKGLIFLTAVSGAFVAGLDAGLVYNSFPKMADKWIPDDILAMNPKLVNFTENPTTVQFNHRVLGSITLAVITGLYLVSRKRVLPRRAYIAAAAVAGLGYLQVALGITTLLTYVPTDIAATHQSGSLALLSAAIWLTHELKKLPK